MHTSRVDGKTDNENNLASATAALFLLPLYDNVLRLLVVPPPEKHGLAQLAILGLAPAWPGVSLGREDPRALARTLALGGKGSSDMMRGATAPRIMMSLQGLGVGQWAGGKLNLAFFNLL